MILIIKFFIVDDDGTCDVNGDGTGEGNYNKKIWLKHT